MLSDSDPTLYGSGWVISLATTPLKLIYESQDQASRYITPLISALDFTLSSWATSHPQSDSLPLEILPRYLFPTVPMFISSVGLQSLLRGINMCYTRMAYPRQIPCGKFFLIKNPIMMTCTVIYDSVKQEHVMKHKVLGSSNPEEAPKYVLLRTRH
jgi:hypothetical protein